MEDFLDDLERPPHVELYMKVNSAKYMLRLLPNDRKERILNMYGVTEEDIKWQESQEPIQSYWDEETRTGDWNRVRDSWEKVKVSYNSYKGIDE